MTETEARQIADAIAWNAEHPPPNEVADRIAAELIRADREATERACQAVENYFRPYDLIRVNASQVITAIRGG